MLIPTRWRDVPACARVMDPAGQIFHTLPQVMPGIAGVRDSGGHTHFITADPDTYVPRVYEPLDAAVDVLRQYFDLEFLKGA